MPPLVFNSEVVRLLYFLYIMCIQKERLCVLLVTALLVVCHVVVVRLA
jgi:hypothetical protein